MPTHQTKNTREFLLDMVCDIVGSILYAVGIYTFAKDANFAPGGISGLALIINHLWGLPIGVMSLVLNVPFVLFCWKVVGRTFLLKTARTMVISTFFLDVIFPRLPAYTGSPFLSALYSGVFLGAGLAIIYMRGSSTGGTDFLTMTIKALHPHLSIGGVTMAIDLLVIVLGWPVFGNVDSVLYGLAATFVTSAVIDKIMYNMGAGKLAIIITNHGDEVARHISDVCGRGSTSIRAMGTYTKENRDILLCACSKSEAYKVRQAAYEVEEEAFVMILETSEVFGEGFSKI